MSSPTDGPAPVPSPDPTPSCFSNSGKVQAGVNNSELWSGADLEELDHYEVLGVEPDAENASVKKAYKSAALKYHPDKHLDGKAKVAAARAFDRVQRAWKVLGDAKARAEYDAMLLAGGEIPVTYEAELSSMTSCDRGNMWTYPCRCGDDFQVGREDLESGYEVFSCPGCSLNLRVLVIDANDASGGSEQEKSEQLGLEQAVAQGGDK